MDAKYYVETDGKVFLVRRGGSYDLPDPFDVPFEVEEVAPLGTGEPVTFCAPYLEAHPHAWLGKDDVVSMRDVAPRVREAIHATMPRVVVEGVCLRDGRVLLVKGSRGLTKDRWALPGGFLRFGESPYDGVLRELHEEVGVDGSVEGLLDVRSKLGEKTRTHWVMILYRVRIHGEPRGNPDEISEVRFVPLADACALVSDELMRGALEALAAAQAPSVRAIREEPSASRA